MIALPIPSKRSPIRYRDLVWRGRNLGEVVTILTKGRLRPDLRAHLDPDLRKDLLPGDPGWRASLGQAGRAQGHLRRQGVRAGDIFLFWGLFRLVDDELRWAGRPEHRVWGWMQVGEVAPVDSVLRSGGARWRWVNRHPHLALLPDPANTLYVARERLAIVGATPGLRAGYGTFDTAAESLRLTAPGSKGASNWSLPPDFLPGCRAPLTYHPDPDRWSSLEDRVLLRTAARGQEFVLDLDSYPGVRDWVVGLIPESG